MIRLVLFTDMGSWRRAIPFLAIVALNSSLQVYCGYRGIEPLPEVTAFLCVVFAVIGWDLARPPEDRP